MGYVLVVVGLLLLLVFLSRRNEGLSFTNSVLFPPMAAKVASLLPIAKNDIPVPAAINYQPRTIAYPSYEDAHAHRLRDVVKRPDGMTLADTALEYKFLNPGV